MSGWLEDTSGDFTADDFLPLQTQPSGDTNPDSFVDQFGTSTHMVVGGGGFGPGYVVKWAVGPGEGFGPGKYYGGYTGEGDRVHWGPYDGSTTDSSTGRTVLNVGSDQSAVVAPDGSLFSSEALPAVGGYVGDNPYIPELDGSLPGGSIEMQQLSGRTSLVEPLTEPGLSLRDASIRSGTSGTHSGVAETLGTDNPGSSGVSVHSLDPSQLDQWEWTPYELRWGRVHRNRRDAIRERSGRWL